MSYHSFKLRRVNKKFIGFGTEPADLDTVVTLLREIFGADAEPHGTEKLMAFNELLDAAKGLVQSREELLNERRHEDLDSEDLEILQESERALDEELAFFCEIFNRICATAGVVEYFGHDTGELIWNEVSDYLARH